MAHGDADEDRASRHRTSKRSRSRSPPVHSMRSRRRASRSHSRSPRTRARSPRRRERHQNRTSRRSRSLQRSPASAASPARRHRSTSRQKDPALMEIAANLPAAQHREELLEALARHRVVICVGETGSGKTTQIPQYLYEAATATADKAKDSDIDSNKAKCIAITQPRRVATISVAQRVAEEMATDVGGSGKVGYAIRFDDHSSEHTRVKFMTDGILVRECLADPLLSKYSCVMLDEAHERSIHTDILFGLLKQLVAKRPDDFRLLVTSATLDYERFAEFFSQPDNSEEREGIVGTNSDSTKSKKTKKKKAVTMKPCPVVKIPGRSFPVDIFHSKQMQIMSKKGPLSTYVRAAVETTLQVHNSEPEGHILVFLTGQQEIEDACQQIRELHRQQLHDGTTPEDMELRVLPLYGALQSKMQRWIFDPVPKNVRKVIVATNIAETSLTIDGIRFVVDCGFTKQKVYNPVQQMESLVIVPISKVSAQQRAGRAGRTGPGKCYRLYSKESYAQMMDETIPEIQRANLANTVLYLKLLGIHDVLGFSYLDPPDKDAILDALKQLFVLGALDKEGAATPLGKLMSAFPLEPKLSRALIEAILLDCERDMVKIVSMLSVENVFEQKKKKHGARGARDRGRRGKRGRDSDESEDDDGNRGMNSWETLMLKFKDEGLLSEYGDHLSYLEIFNEFERTRQNQKEQWCRDRQLRLRAMQMAGSIQKQIQDIVDSLSKRDVDELKKHMAAATSAADDSTEVHKKKTKRAISRSDRLRKSICAGFFMSAARRCTLQTVYRSLNSDEGNDMKLVHFHPQSMLNYVAPPEYCVYQELVVTSKPFMRDAVEVEAKWLDEYTKGKKRIALDQLFALCGHPVPKERQPQLKEAEKTKSGTAAGAPEVAKKKEVDADAISAARARFLARKKQTQA